MVLDLIGQPDYFVRAAVLGEDPGDLSSLEDASVLAQFRR